jgi:hypothetical protein
LKMARGVSPASASPRRTKELLVLISRHDRCFFSRVLCRGTLDSGAPRAGRDGDFEDSYNTNVNNHSDVQWELDLEPGQARTLEVEYDVFLR